MKSSSNYPSDYIRPRVKISCPSCAGTGLCINIICDCCNGVGHIVSRPEAASSLIADGESDDAASSHQTGLSLAHSTPLYIHRLHADGDEP